MDKQSSGANSNETAPSSAAGPSKDSALEIKKKRKESKNCGLKKCFSALVDRKQVNLELEVARLMLRKELNIDLTTLPSELGESMPYMLVHHIRSWPGWLQSYKYYSGEIQFKNWYEQFETFIMNKLDEDINTTYPAVRKEIEEEEVVEKSLKTDQGTQTEVLAPKDFAPFSLQVTGKASMLNTLVFTDSGEGDVIMKQHKPLYWTKSQISNITAEQLLTWPHIGMHFVCPVLEFSRHNKHEYNRYVSIVSSSLPVLNIDRIQQMKILDKNKERFVLSLDHLTEMLSELLKAIKIVYPDLKDWTPFLAGINEFLKDVKEMDVIRRVRGKRQPTFALNTCALFNIGNGQYFRNKKLSKGQPTRYDIGYTEIIIPKIELNFISMDYENIKKYIESLKNFKSGTNLNPGTFSLPLITYSCNYCKNDFQNIDQVVKHLVDEHYMDQDVLCMKCKKSFKIFELTKTRWTHNCPKTANPK
ncbi:hypothetical protein ABEB36_014271 [Hypothenemus hampei]|uniref:C2H2-type domain-containing protein n=1 Tax=Hypothenemus hampei TaxID=57062 RepID=A0ABD1E449_HYPHA